MKRHLAVLVFLLVALPLLGSLPAQAVERPFRLTARGTLTDGAVQATGTATHLGRFAETGTLTFTPDPNDPNIVLASGTLTFTAANGDQLVGTITDVPLDLTTGIATGEIVFTGGTGRFADASGTVGFVVQQNLVTGAFETVALGTLDF
jgi:hypothetical protein